MLKIFDKNKNYIRGIEGPDSARIEKEVNITDTLLFQIPFSLGNIVEEEGYIKTKEGNFVIKEKNKKGNSYEVVGKYDLEDLLDYVEDKAYITMTIKDMIDDLLLNMGWTVTSSMTIKRTVTGTNTTKLALIKDMVHKFRAEIRFDNVNKIIYIEEKLGTDKGVYFHDEVNLKDLSVTSDTYDFATRLIPKGKNDLGIEGVNDGIPYVSNNEYSDKIITLYWKDERYTDEYNLRYDAQKKIDEVAKPLKNYEASVEDLSRTTGYEILSYEPGDVITLVEKETNTREKQRIIKKVKYLYVNGKDTVTIANRARYLETEQEKEIADIRTDIVTTRASLELLDDAVQSKVSQQSYDSEKEQMENNYTDFRQEFDNFKYTVQVGGGNNIIKNSVGYGELNFWDKSVDANIDFGTSTWIMEGISKHGWTLIDGTLSQQVDFLKDNIYTLSGRLRKQTEAGSILIGLYDIATDELVVEIFKKDVTELFDGNFSMQFDSLENTSLELRITATGISEVSPVELTDLMLIKGESGESWSQANGEVYTLDVKIDGKGVRVYQADGKGYTVMSPEEFAGYYNNQKVFTLNRDITEVVGLMIKEKGLYIPPIKFVQTNDSLDVVWTGR